MVTRKTVSPAFMPGAFGNVERDHPEHVKTLGPGRDAFCFTHEAASKAGEVFAKIEADPTLPEAAKKVAKANYFEKRVFREAAQRIDAATGRLRQERQVADNEIRASLQPRSERETLAIQAALRGASKKERGEIVTQGIEDGDKDILGAVVRGKGFLSGHSAPEVEMIRQRWISKHLPEVRDRIEVIERGLDILQRGGNALMTLFTEIMGDAQGAAEKAAEREKAMRE